MPDQKSNPEEGFTFVDKRRVAEQGEDSSPAQDSETDEGTGPAPDSEAPEEDEDDDLDLAADEAEGEEGGQSLAAAGAFGIASYAIGLLSMSAWQFLGLVPDPQTKKAQRDLPQARIAIDCVAGMVDALDKASGAVDPKTMADLKRVLSDLRLNYVTQSNMAKEGK